MLSHPERYEYPDKDNPGQTKKSYRERNAYYHVDPQCVKQRHPHFDASFLRVDNEIKSKLTKVPFDYLQLHQCQIGIVNRLESQPTGLQHNCVCP